MNIVIVASVTIMLQIAALACLNVSFLKPLSPDSKPEDSLLNTGNFIFSYDKDRLKQVSTKKAKQHQY